MVEKLASCFTWELAWAVELSSIEQVVIKKTLNVMILDFVHPKAQNQDRSNTRPRLRRTMLWIAETHGAFPRQIYITEVTRKDFPIAGGRCGDIFNGQLLLQRAERCFEAFAPVF